MFIFWPTELITSISVYINSFLVSEWCSHQMAHIYFVESISSPKFIAYKCERKNFWFFHLSPYYAYRFGFCKNYPTAVMGEDVDRQTRGQFYLSTNAKSPFARS